MAPYAKVSSSRFQSRLAVKSLFNSKFNFESTAPGKTDPIRLEVLKSIQVDLLGSTPMSTHFSLVYITQMNDDYVNYESVMIIFECDENQLHVHLVYFSP